MGGLHAAHLHAYVLFWHFFMMRRCVLALRESLIVSANDGLIELLPEFLGDREADVLVLTISRFIAGHGHKQSLAAVVVVN